MVHTLRLQRRQTLVALVLLCSLTLILVPVTGCGSSDQPTPTPTKTPKPAATDTPLPPTPSPTATWTPIPPTATPTFTPVLPTDTPAPTPTPLPPTATPTPIPPTNTPQPTPAAAASTDTPVVSQDEPSAPEPQTSGQASSAASAPASQPSLRSPEEIGGGGIGNVPMPSGPGVYGSVPPVALGGNVCPLTGLPVANAARLERRPIAVKISNSPAIVRPQAGIASADVLFEHYAEGKVTRFTAVFLSQDVPKVGSIRSARLIDLEIPAMFKSMFTFSGASAGVLGRLRASDFGDRIISPDFGHHSPFERIPAPGKAYEHTLFSNTPTLEGVMTSRGLKARQDLSGWAFSQQPPSGGAPGSRIKVSYRGDSVTAEYAYDAGLGGYRRSTAGVPHADELTSQQVVVKNVVVLYAKHAETDIVEDTWGGGHYSIEIQLWGSGVAKVFRDGQMYDVRWERPNRSDLVRFVDGEGKPLPLKPGNTWIQLVPLDFVIEAG
jgi:hypothetical protein